MTASAQLALDVPLPKPPPPHPPTYWENRGPHDWQPVLIVLRYGNTRGMPDPAFPHVRTKPSAPRNVCIERADGERLVVPVRTLRRENPNAGRTSP
jgi:hypothetical protein